LTRISFPKIGRLVAAVLVASALVLVPGVTAQAASTGTVSVQLTDPARKAWKVGGVTVSVNSTTSSFYREVKTDYRGIATFKGVPTSAKLLVEARTYYNLYWYLGSSKANVAVAKGKTKKVSLPVALGATISGTVKKPGGKALANAKVNVLSKSGAVLTSTNTDSAGKYTVQGLATGSYRLQFNGRQYVGPYESDAAARDYAWSYWGSSSGSWAKAASIAVKQQGKKTAPSVKTNVNSVVTAGTLVTLTLATANAGGQVNVERIISGKVFDRETVYAPLSTDGKSASVRLAAGTYIVGSPYTEGSNKPLKYFTGNGKKLTSDRNKAVLVTVSGSSLTLSAGAAS